MSILVLSLEFDSYNYNCHIIIFFLFDYLSHFRNIYFQGNFDDPRPKAAPVTAAPKERIEMVCLRRRITFSDLSLKSRSFEKQCNGDHEHFTVTFLICLIDLSGYLLKYIRLRLIFYAEAFYVDY
jgi:hypothetical protein